MVAPFIPLVADNFDEQHANHERTLNATEQEELYNKKILLRRDSIQHLFNGYYYNYKQEQEEKDRRESEVARAEKSTATSTMRTSVNATKPNSNLDQILKNDAKRGSSKKYIEKNAQLTPNMKKNLTTDKSAQNSIKYRPEKHKQIFEMTETEDSAVANMKLENELKKLERDDFNNIVGMSQVPSKK